MAYKELRLKVISARDLKSGTMDVYAVVSLHGDSRYRYKKKKTPVHRDGASSPRWNHSVMFTVDEAKLAKLKVVFDLKHKRTFLWDKKLGTVTVPVNDLLPKKDEPGHSTTTFTYLVRTRSGKEGGRFDFSFELCDSYRTPPPPRPPVVRHHRHHDHSHRHRGGDGGGDDFLAGMIVGAIAEEILF